MVTLCLKTSTACQLNKHRLYTECELKHIFTCVACVTYSHVCSCRVCVVLVWLMWYFIVPLRRNLLLAFKAQGQVQGRREAAKNMVTNRLYSTHMKWGGLFLKCDLPLKSQCAILAFYFAVHHGFLHWSELVGLWWIYMIFCTDVHSAQTINWSGDALTFSVAPPAGQMFHLSCEISQRLVYELAKNLVQAFMVPRWCILVILVIPWLFLWHHHEGDIFGPELNVATTIGFVCLAHTSMCLRMNCNNSGHPLTFIQAPPPSYSSMTLTSDLQVADIPIASSHQLEF